ncbi:MAG: MarR family transcriptional regulator [Tistlia sp.]|uniref:MarR family winged helix-turn-helix transcriptional regulator n=1 Tax=Tistlia sp. TaxID=3057121 RepID=UPI0034A54616
MDTCITDVLPGARDEGGPVGLDDQAAHLLRRAHQRASAIYLGLLSEHQLTPAQYFAMARLHERGELSQNRLGRLAAMDPATIQGVMRRLGERGYIERTPDASDRRRMVLRLTRDGRSLIGRLLAESERVNEAVLEPLDEAQRAVFLSLLRRLV